MPVVRQKFHLPSRPNLWSHFCYRYFKVKGDDGNLYILRLDEGRAEWELTMFRTPQAEAFVTQDHPRKNRVRMDAPS